MNTLKILTAALVATFAVAAQAGPYGAGPGGPGSAAAGNVNCPGCGAAYGPGAGAGCLGAGQGERLKAADKNADGFISRDEAQASLPGLAARFDSIDANKDGNISLAELEAGRAAYGRGGRGEGWKKWDANGDGKLTREEVASAPRLAQEFDALDANKDGSLTAEEFQAMRGRGGRGQGFTRWDSNGDGKLAREEVASAPRLAQDFDAIDANKDGFLTLDELQAAHSQHANRGWHRGF